MSEPVFDVEQIKVEVAKRDIVDKAITLGGIKYFIPLQNGDIDKQEKVFDAVDMWLGKGKNVSDMIKKLIIEETGGDYVEGSSRNDAIVLRNLLFQILMLSNPRPEDKSVIYNQATEENVLYVYKTWLGTV